MPERDSYDPGTPSWVDLASPDPEGAKRFYGELFGWTAEEAGPVEETGGYAMFYCGGKRVAGVGPIMGEGQPPVWSTYFATDDVDALAQRVRDAGGTLIMEPMDVMDAGRMGFFAHPAGGMFGAWQAGNHTGAELVNEPVSLAWNQLMTRDRDGAAQFLEAIFGLRAEEQEFGGGPYTVLMLGDRGVGGMMPLPPEVPAQVPAFWNVSFAVEDADATVAKAQELGGSLTMPAMDMQGVGRIAGLADPWGAQFNVAAVQPPA
jgi:predicted enzyme related to lactoylglutathione lyase